MDDRAIADSVIEFVLSESILDEWPEFRQLLITHLQDEPSWNLALPILSCLAVGGNKNEAVPVAAAWSVLHHAALIFDAIQDGHTLSDELKSPEKAISFATSLTFSAYYFLSSIPNAETVKRTTKLFSESGIYSSLGQYTGIAQLNKSYTTLSVREALEVYWQTVIYKSGSIFKAAVGGGAIAGTISDEQINAMSEFGNRLGIILQIIDDCRDILWISSKTNQNETEISLPILLYQASIAQNKDQLLATIVIPSDRETLFNLLQAVRVPQMIVKILQEWRLRALHSLELFKNSDAKTRLETILDLAWEEKLAIFTKL